MAKDEPPNCPPDRIYSCHIWGGINKGNMGGVVPESSYEMYGRPTWSISIVIEVDDLERSLVDGVDLSFDFTIRKVREFSNKDSVVWVDGVHLLPFDY